MNYLAPIIILAVFAIFVVIVILNFCLKPSKAKAVRKFNGWFISVKRLKWDVCDNEEELHEFYHNELEESYPFLNESYAMQVVEQINNDLNK